MQETRKELELEKSRGHVLEPDGLRFCFKESILKERHSLRVLGESKTAEQKERLNEVADKLNKLVCSQENRRPTTKWLKARLGYTARKVQNLTQLSFHKKRHHLPADMAELGAPALGPVLWQ